jgi:photosystem II stability/assembly factor-like uncharacterized protein
MTRSVRRLRMKILQGHKTLGLLVGIPLLFSAITGLLLQYPQLFESNPETTFAFTIDPLQPSHWLRGTDLGLYHSFDNGVTWQESPLMWSPGIFRKLIFSPDDSQVVYALGTDGLLVSNDSGRIWEMVKLILPEEFAWGEFLDLSLGHGGVIGILSRSGMALSKDGGLSWAVQYQTPLETGSKGFNFIHDLHTGYWVGSSGALFVTITAAGTLLLVCSGYILVFFRRTKGRLKHE